MKKPSLKIIGREDEIGKLETCIQAGRSVLLEGPVGVGKTHLAIAATSKLSRKVFRIDGDSRYTEQKLTGWFDPPTVIKKGFSKEAFIPGPLVEAMKSGGVLFINELNRLPEGVQNVLLPALDEKSIQIPRLGELKAKPGFMVVATQNPKEFVATSHLSEAILDRFELIVIDYQDEAEETAIVVSRLKNDLGLKKNVDLLAVASTRLIRLTRNHPKIRRGASIRAALSVAELTSVFVSNGMELKDAFFQSVLMALPTRIEIEKDSESELSLNEEIEILLGELSEEAFSGSALKKK